MNLTTIKDVATHAGVSVATVSAVINKDSGVKVSDKLTKKVNETIKELNYRPNRIARALSRNESKTIGYIVPSITNEFFTQLAKDIEDIAFKKGYGVYLCNTEGDTNRASYYLDSLIENRVAGVITSLTWEIEQIKFINHMKYEKIPIVGLAGARSNKEIDTIIPDDVNGGRIAVHYLLKKGYSNIGFIGIENSQTTKVRLKGFRQAFLETGIEYNSDLINFCSSFSNKEAKKVFKEMIITHPEMDAVFVYNDVIGSAIMETLYELEMRTPQDMAIIGFDNSIASFTFPKMTTISISKKRMARIAMDRLFRRINGELPLTDTIDVKISPELIIRGTT